MSRRPPTPKIECNCGPAECYQLKDACKRIIKNDDGEIIAFIPPPDLHLCPDCHRQFTALDDRMCPYCHAQAKKLTSPFNPGENL